MFLGGIVLTLLAAVMHSDLGKLSGLACDADALIKWVQHSSASHHRSKALWFVHLRAGLPACLSVCLPVRVSLSVCVCLCVPFCVCLYGCG